jgi:hypothetical protein
MMRTGFIFILLFGLNLVTLVKIKDLRLSLSYYDIIKAHSGEIKVESKEGKVLSL